MFMYMYMYIYIFNMSIPFHLEALQYLSTIKCVLKKNIVDL